MWQPQPTISNSGFGGREPHSQLSITSRLFRYRLLSCLHLKIMQPSFLTLWPMASSIRLPVRLTHSWLRLCPYQLHPSNHYSTGLLSLLSSTMSSSLELPGPARLNPTSLFYHNYLPPPHPPISFPVYLENLSSKDDFTPRGPSVSLLLSGFHPYPYPAHKPYC